MPNLGRNPNCSPYSCTILFPKVPVSILFLIITSSILKKTEVELIGLNSSIVAPLMSGVLLKIKKFFAVACVTGIPPSCIQWLNNIARFFATLSCSRLMIFPVIPSSLAIPSAILIIFQSSTSAYFRVL